MYKSFIYILIIHFFLFLPYEPSQSAYSEYGKKIDVVIIDAGHGGKDPGTIGLSDYYEKNINLSIALKLKEYLIKEYNDVDVYLTRNQDEFIDLKSRGKFANDYRGNLFISIHCNAKKNEESNKKGFEIYILGTERAAEALEFIRNENPLFASGAQFIDSEIIPSLTANAFMKYSEKFSLILQTELIKGTYLENRGIYQAGYYVLVASSMPAVLLECGYLTDKSDEEYLSSSKGQDDIAKSVYKSIRYFKFDYDYENSFGE